MKIRSLIYYKRDSSKIHKFHTVYTQKKVTIFPLLWYTGTQVFKIFF